MTPDVIYDQMRARRVARSWSSAGWEPKVRGLNAIRRVTEGAGASLELEEYATSEVVARYTAGAAKLPFSRRPLVLREPDLPVANPLIRRIESPYGDGTVYAVPPSMPNVTVDPRAACRRRPGNTQVWGFLGCQKEAAFAGPTASIVVVEEKPWTRP